ncbi:MAG: peptidoglycan bridge formation glycyltransferase FemA/FemB family protein, partial [Atopobiaceae bacterium]|nr:peptidoglycan bridge formation glycyltransferase FemA/FemB family protein [Atopobiaceae bacterium]
PVPFRALAYAPRGPFARDNASFVAICEAVAQWCAWKTPSVCLRIEPELTEVELPEPWREGDRVLLAKTATVDIVPSEDEIMKSIPNRKCRQYIRKAERDGIVVRHATADDLDDILDLYHATAEADGFSLHVDEYYRTALTSLRVSSRCLWPRVPTVAERRRSCGTSSRPVARPSSCGAP